MMENNSKELHYDVFNATDCGLASIFHGIISCVGILANVLALVALTSVKKKDTAMLLLFSLVAADALTPVVTLVSIIRDPNCDFDLGDVDFMVTTCLQSSSFYAILFTMLGITGDRLVASVKPLRHPQLVTKWRVQIFICFSWLLSFTAGFLPYLVFEITEIDVSNSPQSNESDKDSTDVYTKTPLTILISVAFACFLFLVIVYGIIFHEIYRHRQFALVTRQQARGIVKGTITSILIVGTFTVCWLPYGITYLTISYIGLDKMTPSENNFIHHLKRANFALVLLNSICDPVIYISRNKRVRHSFKDFLKKFRCTACETCSFQQTKRYDASDNTSSEPDVQIKESPSCKSLRKNVQNRTTNSR